MALFGKLFGGGPPKPPRWARAFETKARFDDFVEWLQGDLERRGIPQLSKTLRLGAMTVRLERRNVTVSFFNSAARFAASDDPEAWRRELDDLLTARLERPSLVDSEPEPVERPATALAPAQPAVSLAEARRLLRVQLYPEAQLDALGLDRAQAVIAPFAPGLEALLVYERGDRDLAVPAAHLAAWGPELSDPEDAIAFGIERIREAERVQRQPVEIQPGLSGELIVSEGQYASVWAAEVEPPQGEAWPHGVLLAFPSRHAALLHPLKDAGAALAYGWMAGAAHRLQAEAEGLIASTVYWRRDEDWVALPFQVETEGDQERLALDPPPEFRALLRLLGAKLPGAPAPDSAGPAG